MDGKHVTIPEITECPNCHQLYYVHAGKCPSCGTKQNKECSK